MKYLPLVWAGLSRRPVRTLFTFLSIIVAFLLFGVLHGVSGGFDAAINALSDVRLRVHSRVSFTRLLPLSQRMQIERVPGVRGVAAYARFGGYYKDPRNQIGAGALDIEQLFAVFPELELPSSQRETMLHTRTGALVGEELARKYGWKIGDRIALGTPIWHRKDGTYNWAVDVVGIYRFKNDALPANELWMHYEFFNEGRVGPNNVASMFIVAIDDPSSAARVCGAIDALFRNSSSPTLAQSEKDWVRSRIRRIGNVQYLVNAIVGAVLFTLFALTANTMMESVRERTAEYAVLKTLGYSNRVVVGLVVTEGSLLCVSAAICGLCTAALVFPDIFRRLGVGAVPIPTAVIFAGLGIAVCLALVSSVSPAWRALRLNVITALSNR
jgi:putative ABC transport system permease protein